MESSSVFELACPSNCHVELGSNFSAFSLCDIVMFHHVLWMLRGESKAFSILYRISVLRDNFGKAKPEKKHNIKVKPPVGASCLAFRRLSTAFQGIMQSPFTFLLEESLCRLIQLVSRVKLCWVGEGFLAFLECVNAHT